MRNSVEAILERFLREITEREPDYFSRFPLLRPDIRQLVDHYSVITRHPRKDVEKALSDGLSYLDTNGLFGFGNVQDPVLRIATDTMVDSLNMEGSDCDAIYSCQQDEVFRDQIGEYHERATKNGVRYFIRDKGYRPLLLIGATGIAIGTWRRFLCDEGHDLKIILVEGTWGDLLEGGMTSPGELSLETDRIKDVLEEEKIGSVDVVAWCNGTRIAFDLITKHEVKSLTLISATLRGFAGMPKNQFPLEDSLSDAALDVNLRAALEAFIAEQASGHKWSDALSDPMLRAEHLFRLPPKADVPEFVKPMLQASLHNYCARINADGTYPVHQVITKIAAPVMLIVGSHDNITNNDFVFSAFDRFCPIKPIKYRIIGAGHYSFHLQYSYVKSALMNFLSGAAVGEYLRCRAVS